MSVMSSSIPSWHFQKIRKFTRVHKLEWYKPRRRTKSMHIKGAFTTCKYTGWCSSHATIYQRKCGFERDDSPKFSAAKRAKRAHLYSANIAADVVIHHGFESAQILRASALAYTNSICAWLRRMCMSISNISLPVCLLVRLSVSLSLLLV